MKVLKFKVFTSEELIQWQVTEKREISQISPLVSSVKGDVTDNGAVGMETNISVFVLYWEEAQQLLQPDNAQ